MIDFLQFIAQFENVNDVMHHRTAYENLKHVKTIRQFEAAIVSYQHLLNPMPFDFETLRRLLSGLKSATQCHGLEGDLKSVRVRFEFLIIN